jgi:glycosyltransferase involved in cell wall biosynthesis
MSGAAKIDASLIIPVLNEEASLPRLLQSIRQQTLQPAEIIFVDAGSTDKTLEILEDQRRSDPRLRVISEPGATPGRGRNMGIAAAANRWIALTDAGMELDRDWLNNLVAAIERNPKAVVVYGHVRPRGETYFARCLNLTYVGPVRDYKGERIRGPVVPSMLLRRETWTTAGGFPDLRAGEDRIFMERLARLQVEIAVAPKAVVTWDLPESLVKVFLRFKSYSMHNALAGQQKDWHYGVARLYLGFLVLAIAGTFVHRAFWLVLLLLGLLRSFKGILLRREEHSVFWCMRPDLLISVFFLLLWIDLATFTGWMVATLRRGRAEVDSAKVMAPDPKVKLAKRGSTE